MHGVDGLANIVVQLAVIHRLEQGVLEEVDNAGEQTASGKAKSVSIHAYSGFFGPMRWLVQAVEVDFGQRGAAVVGWRPTWPKRSIFSRLPCTLSTNRPRCTKR